MDAFIFMPSAFVAAFFMAGIHCYLGFPIESRGVIFIDFAPAPIAAPGGSILFAYGQPLKWPVPLETVIGIGYPITAALVFSAKLGRFRIMGDVRERKF